MMNKKKYLLAGTGALILFLFIMWGPDGYFYKTGEPDYCNSCHVMNQEFESWFMTGLHRNIKCVDCHLPHDNIVRYTVWKGIDGMKDLFMFHTGIYSEDIGISSHGKKIIRENCLRCHEGMVSAINTDERDCWSCHRRVNHRFPSISRAEFR